MLVLSAGLVMVLSPVMVPELVLSVLILSLLGLIVVSVLAPVDGLEVLVVS